MNKLESYSVHSEMTMKKKKRRKLVTGQDIEAALQLIQLKNYHDENFIHEPFMKIVLKSKEFLRAQDINRKVDNDDKNNICDGGNENIRKRKSDGIASSSSSITRDLDDNSDGDARNKAVVGSVKKMKKFRSVVDIYNVTKPF